MKPDYIRDWLPAKLKRIMEKFHTLHHAISDEYDAEGTEHTHWQTVNTWINNLMNTEQYPNRSILLEANRLWKLYN